MLGIPFKGGDPVAVARNGLREARRTARDVVIVDTWAQTTPGANENSGEDMGKALAHCKGIHRATGAMVMLVHHSGKDASRGARGWSGLRAAADVELEVVRADEARSLTVTKLKDGEDGAEFAFRLESVVLGLDEDGWLADSDARFPLAVRGKEYGLAGLARAYVDANRGAQAVRVLQEAQARFPQDPNPSFELGSVLEKQKKYADAETAFRQALQKNPKHAPSLNYLGYMLAERGERLNESVSYIKKALELEPDNGSYLDSLGWAYFKDGQLELAEQNLKRAATQLGTNAVIQEHYGDVLFKMGRFKDAIDAWTKALSGDADDVDRGSVDKKIKSARSKLPKK
mgnify:CR=1 FL=1